VGFALCDLRVELKKIYIVIIDAINKYIMPIRKKKGDAGFN
jgi:hypothetical protein